MVYFHGRIFRKESRMDSQRLNPGVEAIKELFDASDFEFQSGRQPSRHDSYLQQNWVQIRYVRSAVATRPMPVDGERYARFAKIPYGPANCAPGDIFNRAFSELFPVSEKKRRDQWG